MAQDKSSKNVATEPEDATSNGVPAPSLFRLPRFFTQSAEVDREVTADEAASDEDGATTGSSVTHTKDAPKGKAGGTHGGTHSSGAQGGSELSALRDEIERLTEQVTLVNERESALERVFDALHAELADYKNDFLYEHLKPVVRPLLFLFDSIEQFDHEVAMTEATQGGASSGLLSPPVVRENISYFRDQLVEALRVCEVTIMDTPKGAFNAKFHKAVDVVPVGTEQDGHIIRVVRSGWFLNGQLLRPADVVVGKYRGQS